MDKGGAIHPQAFSVISETSPSLGGSFPGPTSCIYRQRIHSKPIPLYPLQSFILCMRIPIPRTINGLWWLYLVSASRPLDTGDTSCSASTDTVITLNALELNTAAGLQCCHVVEPCRSSSTTFCQNSSVPVPADSTQMIKQTSRLCGLPSVLFIGTSKCETSSVRSHLVTHPDIRYTTCDACAIPRRGWRGRRRQGGSFT